VLVSSNTEAAYYERAEIAAAIGLARKAADRHRVVPVYLDAGAATGDGVPYGLELKHGLRLADDLSLEDAAARLLDLLSRLRKRSGVDVGAEGGKAASAAATGLLHQPASGWKSPVRDNRWAFKLAAFDFDGTLLRGKQFGFSWEMIWKSLGFNARIQQDLKREYRQQTAADPSRQARVMAYRKWCEHACTCFQTRGLTREQLTQLVAPLTLTKNCREALTALREAGVVVAIISGGVSTFVEDTFPDYRDYVDFLFMNELLFGDDGKLTGVRASEFDFQGKAEALQLVCDRVGCAPAEAIFVGDHFNDESVMLKVGKAIAYPPQDAVVSGVVHASIVEDDLTAVVPHVLVE
jgi:HAD superfamily phosphoserine phosphatase-like hydrolase